MLYSASVHAWTRSPSQPSSHCRTNRTARPHQLPASLHPQRFANELAAKGMKLIPIVDPGVKMDPNYATYLDGLGQSVYLRGQDLQPYVGWVSEQSPWESGEEPSLAVAQAAAQSLHCYVWHLIT